MVYNNEEGERSSKERIAPAKQSAQEYNVPAGHEDRLGQGSVILTMANYPVTKIRNVCLMGHGGDGKTSLVESLLNIAGVTDRVGKIADGITVCDFDPEEI